MIDAKPKNDEFWIVQSKDNGDRFVVEYFTRGDAGRVYITGEEYDRPAESVIFIHRVELYGYD